MSDDKTFNPAEAIKAVGVGFEAFKEANNLRIKQIEEKGVADPVTADKLAKIEADIDAKQAQLDKFELSMKRQNRTVTDATGAEIDLDAKAMHHDLLTHQARL